MFVPSGTVGYNKAEVTRGGVDTDGLSVGLGFELGGRASRLNLTKI
jgi:hypothetical protein